MKGMTLQSWEATCVHRVCAVQYCSPGQLPALLPTVPGQLSQATGPGQEVLNASFPGQINILRPD